MGSTKQKRRASFQTQPDMFYWPCEPRFCLGFDTSLGFCRCCIYNLSYCDSVKRANNYSGKTKKITAESFQCLAIKVWPLQIF